MDKVEELGKRIESFTKIIQESKEAFTDSLYRLTSAVDRMISDPDVGQILIESLALENANVECKRIIRPLRTRSAPKEEWIRHIIDIAPHTSNVDTWIGALLSKNIKKNINFRCFNCGRQDHLKKSVKKLLLEIMFIIELIQTEGHSLLECAEDVAKADFGLMNVDQQGIDKKTLCHWEVPAVASCRPQCQM